jgi:hypothetical protein
MVFMGFTQQTRLVDFTLQHRSTMDSQSEWVFFQSPVAVADGCSINIFHDELTILKW